MSDDQDQSDAPHPDAYDRVRVAYCEELMDLKAAAFRYRVPVKIAQAWKRAGRWEKIRTINRERQEIERARLFREEEARRRAEADPGTVYGEDPPLDLTARIEAQQDVLRVAPVADDMVEYLDRARQRLAAVEFVASARVEDVVRRIRESQSYVKQGAEVPAASKVSRAEIGDCLSWVQKLDDMAFTQAAMRMRVESQLRLLEALPVPGVDSEDEEDG